MAQKQKNLMKDSQKHSTIQDLSELHKNNSKLKLIKDSHKCSMMNASKLLAKSTNMVAK